MGGTNDPGFNPYAAPSSPEVPDASPDVVDPEAEAIRREHIGREKTIKAMGLGCYFVAAFLALGTVNSVLRSVKYIFMLKEFNWKSEVFVELALKCGVRAIETGFLAAGILA